MQPVAFMQLEDSEPGQFRPTALEEGKEVISPFPRGLDVQHLREGEGPHEEGFLSEGLRCE
jgi:hypothetical protein